MSTRQPAPRAKRRPASTPSPTTSPAAQPALAPTLATGGPAPAPAAAAQTSAEQAPAAAEQGGRGSGLLCLEVATGSVQAAWVPAARNTQAIGSVAGSGAAGAAKFSSITVGPVHPALAAAVPGAEVSLASEPELGAGENAGDGRQEAGTNAPEQAAEGNGQAKAATPLEQAAAGWLVGAAARGMALVDPTHCQESLTLQPEAHQVPLALLLGQVADEARRLGGAGLDEASAQGCLIVRSPLLAKSRQALLAAGELAGLGKLAVHQHHELVARATWRTQQPQSAVTWLQLDLAADAAHLWAVRASPEQGPRVVWQASLPSAGKDAMQQAIELLAQACWQQAQPGCPLDATGTARLGAAFARAAAGRLASATQEAGEAAGGEAGETGEITASVAVHLPAIALREPPALDAAQLQERAQAQPQQAQIFDWCCNVSHDDLSEAVRPVLTALQQGVIEAAAHLAGRADAHEAPLAGIVADAEAAAWLRLGPQAAEALAAMWPAPGLAAIAEAALAA